MTYFNHDLCMDLTERLRYGGNFTNEEIDFIAQWAGDDDKGAFYDQRIITEYSLDVESGENTWPKLAALLRARESRKTVAI